jgi:hydrogenase-4 component E
MGFGGVALVLSFGLLYQRRLAALINVCAMQAWAVSAAAAWQGWVQRSPGLCLVGLIVLGANGVAIPLALRRSLRRHHGGGAVDMALGIFPGMTAGAALVALTVLATTTMINPVMAREDFVLALSVVLLGLLMLATRRTALTDVVGFASIGNGLILALVGVRGMPLVVGSSVAVLMLAGAVAFGAVFLRAGEVER